MRSRRHNGTARLGPAADRSGVFLTASRCLQTADYMRTSSQSQGSAGCDGGHGAKGRQRILTDPARRFQFLISEWALRPPVCAERDSAVEASGTIKLENVDIQVLRPRCWLPGTRRVRFNHRRRRGHR